MAYQKITSGQRYTVNALRDRAWAAGLESATFSQIAADITGWRQRIAEAEAAKVAEQSATTEPETGEPASMVNILRAAGRTVRQIAAALGVAISTVYRWAHGGRASTVNAVRLAALAA
ncbi:MAG TPA: helix-turn-helix domain-containing protein [Kutzneria sp.]|jgi:hypothetical protein|nr:helix-turn-helix domain-containing protein [Kutzneria sp.]